MKLGNRLSNKICPDDMTIEEWQVALRRETAQMSNFKVEHLDRNRIWGDYLVSGVTGRYKVAFRGVQSDRNFCSCLDFRGRSALPAGSRAGLPLGRAKLRCRIRLDLR